MEKIYSIHNLDCANCAAKAEAKIRGVPGVESADITFATMQLRLTAEDPDALLPQVLAAARKIEPDIAFTDRTTITIMNTNIITTTTNIASCRVFCWAPVCSQPVLLCPLS